MGSWNKRYEEWYGLPAGRPREIQKVNLKDHYTVIRTIDGGNIRIGALNHGIHVVKRKVDGKVCVQKGLMADHKYLRREIHLLHHLKHPNIVEFVDAFITPRPREACLYMEYCELGSLHGIVTRYEQRKTLLESSQIPEVFIWEVFKGLASALQYLHHGLSPGDPSPIQPDGESDEKIVERIKKKWPTILHRDLKLDNILLRQSKGIETKVRKPLGFPLCFFNSTTVETRQRTPNIVLADFGVACQAHDTDWENKDQTIVGTPRWMPPELPVWTERGEIWSLGAIILSMCNLLPKGPLPEPPKGSRWEADVEKWYASKMARRDILEFELDKEYSQALSDIIYNCLREDRDDRPFAFRLLKYIKEGKGIAERDGYVVKNKLLAAWAFGKK